MDYSTYQMERLIDRLRRLGPWLGWSPPPLRPAADPVRASTGARQAGDAAGSESARDGVAAATPPRVQDVRAAAAYPPRVEAERERRAGSFMQPPYLPDPVPGPIPKTPRKPRPAVRTRPVAKG